MTWPSGRAGAGLILACVALLTGRTAAGPPWRTPDTNIYQPLQGTLFKYGDQNPQVAFMTGNHSQHVVLVGGLGFGLNYLNFTAPLAEALDKAGWSLVQPLLSSAGTGWGIGSVDADAAELGLLAQELKDTWGSTGLVLLGHSTGTQDTVRYVQSYANGMDAAKLLGVILQAPVSDPELWPGFYNQTDALLAKAKAMIAEGKGQEILFRAYVADGAPVTAERFASLAGQRGNEDMFSTYLTDPELEKILGPLRPLPSLLLLGGADQYVSDPAKYRQLGARWQAILGSNATVEVAEGGSHGLEGKEAWFVQRVLSFLDGATAAEVRG